MNAINKMPMDEKETIANLFNCWKHMGVLYHSLPTKGQADKLAENCADEMERVESLLSSIPAETVEDLHAKLTVLAYRNRDDLVIDNNEDRDADDPKKVMSDLLISALEDALRLKNMPHPFSEIAKQELMSLA